MSNKISEILNIDHHEIIIDEPSNIAIIPSVNTPEDTDFDAVRTNYYELIDQGKAAMHTAMRIAAESENPRAIEVLSGLLKNMADVNKQLLSLSKDKADIKTAKGTKSAQPIQQIGNVEQAVFVGNSADLNKILAEKTAIQVK